MAANPLVPMPELQLDAETTATEIIFRCSGRITSDTSSLLQGTVRKVIPEKKNIVLDLSNVAYVDSSGLGAIVSLWVSAQRAGCELKLISLSQRVKELLHLTSLDKVFATSRFPNTPSF
jgi:anti-sigma B factor antagonist